MFVSDSLDMLASFNRTRRIYRTGLSHVSSMLTAS
nr:MAG TPA: serine/threonine-protein kinase [Caudoviricetes sp.]